MQKWYHVFQKNTGLSFYVWIIFCILPFYFIFRSSSMLQIILGIFMILIFFTSYRLSFISKSGLVYLWVSLEIAISIGMTLSFGYVYFSLFLAVFIGNIQSKVGYSLLYVIHLVSTLITVIYGFFTQQDLFFSQFPFIVITIIGVILLPFNTYNRIKQGKLEGQLVDANKRLSKLVVLEERQRIGRDLHDTLGQKLSLIGLKSDLARKLIDTNPESAKVEILDIRQTARTALKEVREMVSNMRGAKLEDEILIIQQVLKAAQMDFSINGNPKLNDVPLFVENVLSMCLKEAVTNVVKHSQASTCNIMIRQTEKEMLIIVQDNGLGMPDKIDTSLCQGIRGMKERLEFVNGSLEIESIQGTSLHIRVPNVILQRNKEGFE